jgi:glycosyltransferase involved in cell wall biosynthesis
MAKIKIAIDISPLSDGNSVRGVGHYTKHLVDALQQEIKSNPEYKNWQIDLIKNCKLKIRNYNLIHYPYFDPFKLTLPSKKNIPTIVTVHDLIPRQFKKEFPVGIKGEIKWFIQKLRLLQSNYLISVSHYSKYIIQDITKFPEDRIFVTHEAADKSFKKITDKNKLNLIKQKYNLPDKFILFVGDINWNKNVPNLVKACLHLKYPLVIVGSAATRSNLKTHPWNKDLIWLQSVAEKHKNSKELILTGFVPDEDLPYFYNLATIYCQPSFAEGFGLPVIQAMQSGCPVAFSKETSLPEIMDYNGIFFDPHSIKDIKNALTSLWVNIKLRQKFSKAGLERSKVFSWKSTALQTLALYRLAIEYEK